MKLIEKEGRETEKESLGSEMRFWVGTIKLPQIERKLANLGGEKLIYPEPTVQTIYCATTDARTPKRIYLRLRRYLDSPELIFAANDPFILEAKQRRTREKFRAQFTYDELLHFLASPRELLPKADFSKCLRPNWPITEVDSSLLQEAMSETNFDPLFPTAGTQVFRTYFLFPLYGRASITIDTDICYFGFFDQDFYSPIVIKSEGGLAKLEIKQERRNKFAAIWVDPLKSFLSLIGGKEIGFDEQETKLRKYYLSAVEKYEKKLRGSTSG